MSTATAHGSALLVNDVGLHARPSVKFTQLAKTFDASVEFALSADGPWIDAKSPVKVMRAKAPRGTRLHLRADGIDAAAAVQAMITLIERHFADPADPTNPPGAPE
jgi:phosphocarrier protein